MNKVLKKSKLLVLAVPAVALQTGCSMNYVDETVYFGHREELRNAVEKSFNEEGASLSVSELGTWGNGLVKYGTIDNKDEHFLCFPDCSVKLNEEKFENATILFESSPMINFYITEDMSVSRATLIEGKMVDMGDLTYFANLIKHEDIKPSKIEVNKEAVFLVSENEKTNEALDANPIGNVDDLVVNVGSVQTASYSQEMDR